MRSMRDVQVCTDGWAHWGASLVSHVPARWRARRPHWVKWPSDYPSITHATAATRILDARGDAFHLCSTCSLWSIDDHNFAKNTVYAIVSRTIAVVTLWEF